MHIIDYSIIVVYLLALVIFGVYLQKKAGKGIDSFFLGDRNMPWWALGASGMASNMDVAGTMIIVAMIYALGLKGFFIELRGGIVLIMAFLMTFMGKWNRRSGAMTVAEWMELRFGRNRQGNIARLLSAIANLIFAIGVITYFTRGGGIFLGKLLGIDPNLAGLIMIGLATIYTVASGLYGVVYTDVVQGVLMFIAVVYVVLMVFFTVDIPETFQVSVPMGGEAFKTLNTNLDSWSSILPDWKMNLPGKYSEYNLFGLVILFYLLKTTIEGSGGSGGYLIQRYFAAKNDREAGLLSVFWIFLLSFRWPFVASIAVLGVVYGANHGVIANPEEVLPTVLMDKIPIGITGLIIAGLTAAAMSTFDSVVNSGAAYWVRDVYQRFINPDAGEKQLIFQSRASSLLIVIVAVLLTYQFKTINEVWGWLQMGLGPGLIIPQFIRWYWWRFNGYGYAWGVFAGMFAAFAKLVFFPEMEEYMLFLTVSGFSLIASIVATLVTAETPEENLINFYEKTRPFGFWGHIRAKVPAKELKGVDAENRRDIISTVIAVPWMLILCITPMLFVTKQWGAFGTSASILVVLSILLYFTWFRHLSTENRVTIDRGGTKTETGGDSINAVTGKTD